MKIGINEINAAEQNGPQKIIDCSINDGNSAFIGLVKTFDKREDIKYSFHEKINEKIEVTVIPDFATGTITREKVPNFE